MTKKRSIIALTLAVLLIAVIAIVGTMKHGDAASISINLSSTSNTSGLYIYEDTYTFGGETKSYTAGTEFIITGTQTNVNQPAVSVANGVDANITLSGVNITAMNGISGIFAGWNSTGNVTITIADGTTNTITGGNGNAAILKAGYSDTIGTLTIKGGEEGTGKLVLNGGNNTPAIGSYNQAFGKLVIDGGVITANGGANAPAIGVAYATSASDTNACSDVTINGGILKLTGGTNAAAIGGSTYTTVSNITINGGIMTVAAGTSGYDSIGGGASATVSDIVINGGSVLATNGMGVTPRNNDGTYVYRRDLANPNSLPVLVDGNIWGVANHKALDSSDTYLHAWIPNASTMALQGTSPTEIPIDISRGSLVIDEDTYKFGETTYSYVNGTEFVLSGSTALHNVTVIKDVDANVTFNGVSISLGANPDTPYPAFDIQDESNGDVRIMIAANTTNNLTGGWGYAAIQNGKYSTSTTGTLTIDGEDDTTSKLFCYSNNESAAIGGGTDETGRIRSTRNLYIYGGYIYIPTGVTSNGNTYNLRGACIGAGIGGNAYNMKIYGGTITAYASNEGSAAIGSAGTASNVYNLYIYGGTITADSGKNAAAIGSGTTGVVSGLYIYGGDIKAYGGQNGAGIGTGATGNATYIGIYGGNVYAWGGLDAAGIGTGGSGTAKNIAIRYDANGDGNITVTAIGNGGTTSTTVDDIGNGVYNSTEGSTSNIYINSGSVKATTMGCTPTSTSNGTTTVVKHTIANPNNKVVRVNGVEWTPRNHTALDSSDTNLYAWYPSGQTYTLGPINPTVTAPTAKTLTYNGSEQTLINAGSTTGGTIQYKLSTATTWSSSLPKATDAGTYTVQYRIVGDGEYWNSIGAKTVTVTIAKAASSVTTAPTAISGLVYTGSSQKLIKAGVASGGTLVYKLSTGNAYTTNIPGAALAKTYTVQYYVQGDSNHNDSAVKTLTVTIAKAASSVTKAPTAKTLTYNGSAQALVNAGTASGGTMQYAVTTTTTAPSTYSASIPTKTEPGTYYVWYKVVGDSNHTDLIPGKYVTVKIAKADPTVTLPTLKTGLKYTGSAQALINAGTVSTGSGHFEYSYDGATWFTSVPSKTNAGTYTIYYKVTSTTQYNGIASTKLGTVTISKVASSVTTAPTAKTLTYSGNAQALVNAGTASGGTMQYAVTTTTTAPSTYSASIPTKTNAGTYYVWYKVAGDSNHTDLTPGKYVTVTIKKSTPAAPTGLTANAETVYGKADGTITGLTTSMQVSTDGGTTWTNVTDPAMKFAAGTVKVRTKATSNTNASAATTLTIASGSYLKVTVTPLTGVTATSTSDLTQIAYNDSVTLTVVLSTGFSKTDDFAVYVNGDAVTVDSSNQFTISNMTANATVSFAGVKDLNPPVIEGVENGGSYYVTQEVTVTDDNLTSVTVNGTDYTSKIPFTIAGDKDATYTIVAKDAGGNIVTYKVTMQPIETVAEPIDGMTPDNVTEKDIPTIQGVLEEALGIDTDDATDDEKAEVQAIIDKCIELLAAIPGGMVFDMSKGSLVIYDTYFTFGDNKANYEAGMEFILTGSTDKYTVTVKKDVDANITLDGVSIVLPYTPVAGASGVDNEKAPILIETDSTGDVNITIADGSVNNLTAGSGYAGITKNKTYGVTISDIGTLTINGETKGNGVLNAKGRSGSGIGSSYAGVSNGFNTLNIVINGGTINASVLSGNGSGIGGYRDASGITINGGTITATGGAYGVGIGAGGYVYYITINGGTIVANGGTKNHATAIGGYYVNSLVINGGDITAIATATNSPGIGSEGGNCINLHINDGVIYAQGGPNSPGIGTVTGEISGMNISGGTITAVAGEAQYDATYIVDDIGYGINADGTTTGTMKSANSVIIKGGSVKANISKYVPTKGSGVKVYLNEIKNPESKNVYADGKWWSPVNHTALDKDDTTLYAWLPEDATYELAPIDPTLTAPTAKTPVYTGYAQELVNAGTTSGGKIMYSLDGKTYSEVIPTATDAGDYTVYWYVDNDGVEDYYNATKPATIKVTIGVANPDEAPSGLTFNDETVAGKEDGTIDGLGTNMEYSLDGGKTWIPVTDPDMTFAPGDVSVRYEATDNTTASPATTGTIGSGKYLTIDTEEVENATIVSDDDLDKIVYGDDVTFQVEIPTGFTATEDFKVMVDGKTITPDKDGNYTISDITSDKNLTVVGVKDLNPPKIEGVTDGETYYVSQDVTVTDDNVKSVTVNGEPYTGEFPLTLKGDVDTTYEIVAEDEGGNITTVTVTMKPIETIAEPIDGMTPENVTEDDRPTIEGVLEKAENIDITDATDEEKEEIQEIIDRCNELLDALKGTTATFEMRHSLNLLDLVQIGYWFTATPDKDGVEFVDYGLLIWDEQSYLAETDFTVTSKNAYQPELSLRAGYQMGFGEGVYAQYLDTKYYAIPYAVTADGEYVYAETPDVYAIPMYAQEQGFINSTDEYLKTVVYDLLNYATFAQYYFFERNTDIDVSTLTPINSVLAEENQISRFDESMLVEGHTVSKDTANDLDCTWLYSTANLETAIALNFFAEQSDEFTGMMYWNASAYNTASSLTNGTETAKISVVDRWLYGSSTTTGQIDAIYAKDLASPQYACMYNETDGEYTYGPVRVDSVAAYITRGINATDENASDENYYFVEMCRRMLAYGDSAKTYAETR